MYSLENGLGIHPVGSAGERKFFLSDLRMMKICLGKKKIKKKIILFYNCNAIFYMQKQLYSIQSWVAFKGRPFNHFFKMEMQLVQ